jgi:small conductance mechanosensitive channel
MPADLLERLSDIGVRILIALGVLIVGRVLAALGRWLVLKLTNRPKVVKNLGPSMRSFLAQTVYVVVMMVAGIIALRALGVPDNVLAWGLGLILVLLAVSLSRSLNNLAATVIFIIFRPFQLGDDIETLGTRGVVEDIHIFDTVLRRFDHTVASLPNGAIHEAGVLNHSRTGIIWAPVDVTVSYGANLARVRETILEVVKSDARVLDEPPPDVVVLRLDADGVVFQAQPTVRHEDLWTTMSDLHSDITTRLLSEGVALSVAPETRVRMLPTEPAGDA